MHIANQKPEIFDAIHSNPIRINIFLFSFFDQKKNKFLKNVDSIFIIGFDSMHLHQQNENKFTYHFQS